MRGRILFKFASPFLFLFYVVLKILPTFLVRGIFSLVRYVPGLFGLGLRYVLLKRLCKGCGDNVAIFENVFIYNPQKLVIGSNVSIHEMCYLDAAGGISIGNDVSIAHGTTIMSSNHNYSIPTVKIRDAPIILGPVTICDNVWVGAGVRILSGVNIGCGSVIGAGAVVTRDIPAGSIAVGVPARVIKRRWNNI